MEASLRRKIPSLLLQLLLHLLLAFGSYMVIMLFSIMVTGQLHEDAVINGMKVLPAAIPVALGYGLFGWLYGGWSCKGHLSTEHTTAAPALRKWFVKNLLPQWIVLLLWYGWLIIDSVITVLPNLDTLPYAEQNLFNHWLFIFSESICLTVFPLAATLRAKASYTKILQMRQKNM